jgi:hypothetical protein
MLSSIELKFSETGVLSLPAKGITIFVGPNNAGKSLVLREVEQLFTHDPLPPTIRILTDYEIEWPSAEGVQVTIAKAKPFQHPDVPAGQVILGKLTPGGNREILQMDRQTLHNVVQDKTEKGWLATQYLRWGMIRLDGRSRFNLTSDQNGGDLLAPARQLYT